METLFMGAVIVFAAAVVAMILLAFWEVWVIPFALVVVALFVYEVGWEAALFLAVLLAGGMWWAGRERPTRTTPFFRRLGHWWALRH